MLLYLLSIAATAVVFADVLVRPGMLLAPVQRWCHEMYAGLQVVFCKPKAVHTDGFREYWLLQDRWWWNPLWGCPRCVAGQWGFWGYLIRYHAHYSLPEHLAFTAFTIIAAIIIQKWISEN